MYRSLEAARSGQVQVGPYPDSTLAHLFSSFSFLLELGNYSNLDSRPSEMKVISTLTVLTKEKEPIILSMYGGHLLYRCKFILLVLLGNISAAPLISYKRMRNVPYVSKWRAILVHSFSCEKESSEEHHALHWAIKRCPQKVVQ